MTPIPVMQAFDICSIIWLMPNVLCIYMLWKKTWTYNAIFFWAAVAVTVLLDVVLFVPLIHIIMRGYC